MSSVIWVVLVAIVVIAVEAFWFKRKIRSEQEWVDTLEEEKKIMLEEKRDTVAKLEEMKQKITEKWQIQIAKGPLHIFGMNKTLLFLPRMRSSKTISFILIV